MRVVGSFLYLVCYVIDQLHCSGRWYATAVVFASF